MSKVRKFKKIFIYTLIFLMTLSSGIFNVGAVKASQQNIDQLRKHTRSVQNEDTSTKIYKSSDVVRVIVELDGKPAISYATQQGVRYKDLSQTKKEDLQTKVKTEQSNFITQVKSKNIKLSIENKFTTVTNGISGKIKYGDISQLKRLSGVSNVYIANEYQRPVEKPDMITSKDQVQARETWNLGYDGEGMVVGIIDTGIDSTHRDMALPSDTKTKFSEEKINDLVSADGLPGKYYTSKVPYGYNYADKNNEIRDLGPNATMHGMHVAGIVGANGDEKNGGIQGVAPKAQLLALKVFGNDPGMRSTYGDIYIKAIDDAIKLGADVLNMSLGSSAAFVDANDPEQQSIQRAVDNGVLVSISAGNSAYLGNGYRNPLASNPLASNPDVGVVGAPGLSNSSIAVASIENTNMQVDGLKYTIGDESGSAAFLSASSVHPNEVDQKTFDVVPAGLGNPSDFVEQNFTGKYALVQRGSIPFVDKAINAQAAGAAGVIIYNNNSGIINMATDATIKIPQLFMLQADGEKLKDALTKNKSVKITFDGEKSQIDNPDAGKMSAFSSWGVTPNLDFKPEITAPGGQIYSTLNNNQYGLMSGTSMAAPHVSGGSALVLEKVQKDFPDLKGAEKVNRAKTILMNTSKPVIDATGTTYYSPRLQGAGVMQLESAVETPVYVTNKGTNEGKVALKEIKDDTFTINLTATNFGTKSVTYNLSAKVLTDAIKGIQFAMKEQEITKAKVKFNQDTITIDPGKSQDIVATIDLSDAKADLEKVMKNGYFVEGYIMMTSTEENPVPNLSVPYVGFKGDWNNAPVLDGTIYDDDSFYRVSGMVDEKGNYLGENPITQEDSKDKIAFSPNGDGYSDKIAPYLSFLRNSKTVEYSILDANGNQLRKLRTDTNQRKDYYDSGNGSYFTYEPTLTSWDGLVNNKEVADGTYYYQIKTQIDYPGKEPQVKKIPVIVDTKSPAINGLTYNKDTNSISFDAADVEDGSGINYVAIVVNGKEVDDLLPIDVSNHYEYTVNDKLAIGSNIEVVAFDYAGNYGDKSVRGIGDTTIPYITATSPEALSVHNSRDISFTGYVNDNSDIDELTLTGDKVQGSPVKIELKWNDKENRYDFDTPITFKEDGVHDIYVSGTDSAGNHIEFRRQVIIDSQSPTIDVKGLPDHNYVSDSTESIKLTATVGDNYDQMTFKVNGNEEYTHDFNEPYAMRTLSRDVDVTIPLDHGKNDIVLTAEDIAGNVTTQVVTIYKGVQLDKPVVNAVTDHDTKVSGIMSVAGSTITVKANSKVLGTGLADSSGKFSIGIQMQKADTVLEVTAAKDGLYSPVVTVNVQDKTVPSTPKVNVVSDHDTKVSGTAEVGSSISVYAGKTELGTGTTNSKGVFSVSINKAQKAGTSLTVTAKDKSGNTSKATVVKVQDKTAPIAPKVNEVTNKTTRVSGKAEVGSKIAIYAGKTKVGIGTTDKKGIFSVSIKSQKVGTSLTVTATDTAGNISKSTKIVVKQAPPATPSVDTVKAGSTTVTGKAEPGAKVYVKVGKKVIGSATVDKHGHYSVKIKKQKAGTNLYVYAVKSSKASSSKKVTVKK